MDIKLIKQLRKKNIEELSDSCMPVCVVKNIDNNTSVEVISDGLCSFFDMDRDELVTNMKSGFSDRIHPEDSRRIRKITAKFLADDTEFNTCCRYRSDNEADYRFIHCCGFGAYHDDYRLMFILFSSVPMDEIFQFIAEESEEKSGFSEFLRGESTTDIPFINSGFKGFSVWNLSRDIAVRDSGLGYAKVELGNGFGYSDYLEMHIAHLDNEDDIAYIRELSAEKLIWDFAEGKIPEAHTFVFSTRRGKIWVRVTPSLMKSPENGELFLKLQTENVTENAIFQIIVNTSSEAAEFMAYIDGYAQCVYLLRASNGINIQNQCRSELYQMLPMLSASLGMNIATVPQLINFLSEKCPEGQKANIVTRVSNGRIMSIRMQSLDSVHDQFFISGTDVTELMKSDYTAYYDRLTGLLNMSSFRIMAEATLKYLHNQRKSPSFVYFDVRDMKAINEKHGFSKGDGVLTGIAYVLSEVFPNEPIARIGEDHFVVLTERKRIEQKLEDIYEKVLNNPIGFPVLICAGIYIYEGKKIDISAACDRARLACKSLKGDYNRKYRFYDRDMYTEYHQHRHILNHFDEALENGCIKVYYHPIVRAVTGSICDMEALSRWMDPEKGMLSPAQFISVLEENKLINKLDFYMVRKICENLAIQKSRQLPLVPVSVNLSRINFERCDVVDEVTKIVDEYNLSHSLLTIEITESAFINNQMVLASQINRFREAGFGVWMDDFGSEYSSLNTLQEFSFDLIKLDMRFMKNFASKGPDKSILPDVIRMISKLGIHTLCEGVQTADQLNFLRDIGCEKIQGYLYSKPMPCEYFLNENDLSENLGYDDFRKASYYERIGTVNIESEILRNAKYGYSEMPDGIPAGIVEYRDGQFRILRANAPFKNIMLGGEKSRKYIESDYGTWVENPSERFTKAALACLSTTDQLEVSDITESGSDVSVRMNRIAYDPRTQNGSLIVIITRYQKAKASD